MDNKDNKDFRCVMFANDSRHPKAPKFKIMFTINGKDYVSSVWLATDDNGQIKTTKAGQEYFTGKIQTKEEAEQMAKLRSQANTKVQGALMNTRPDYSKKDSPKSNDSRPPKQEMEDDFIPF